jgi:predicted nucleotidyltransferase
LNQHIEYILNNTTPPKWMGTNLHYVTIMGSVAYGCNNNEGERSSKVSDLDLYGFCMPPKHIIFPHLHGHIRGFGKEPENFEQFQQHHIQNPTARKEYDVTIFSIIKYFQLLMDNNPNMIDSIYTADNLVLHKTEIGSMVRDNRHLFLSKQVKVKMAAYAYQQLRKLAGNIHAGSEARQESINTVGYDVKKAYHTVRLMLQAEQILMEGTLDLLANAEILKDIRAGNWTLEEVQNYFTNKETLINSMYQTSSLQLKPDVERIKQLLINCIEHHYGSLSNAELVVPNKHTALVAEIESVLERYKK